MGTGRTKRGSVVERVGLPMARQWEVRNRVLRRPCMAADRWGYSCGQMVTRESRGIVGCGLTPWWWNVLGELEVRVQPAAEAELSRRGPRRLHPLLPLSSRAPSPPQSAPGHSIPRHHQFLEKRLSTGARRLSLAGAVGSWKHSITTANPTAPPTRPA